MTNYAVVFNSNNACVVKHCEAIVASNVLINPDLSKVKKIDTVYWRNSRGRVVPFVGAALKRRSAHVAYHGRDLIFKQLGFLTWLFTRIQVYVQSWYS